MLIIGVSLKVTLSFSAYIYVKRDLLLNKGFDRKRIEGLALTNHLTTILISSVWTSLNIVFKPRSIRIAYSTVSVIIF